MVSIFEKQEVKTAKAHVRNLVALAKSDGVLSKSEVECIFKIGLKKGLSKDKVRQIIKSETSEYSIPTTMEGVFEQLYDIVLVVLADGIVKDKEITFAANIAEQFGIRTTVKELLIVRMIQDVEMGKEKAEIFEDSKPFLV